MKKLIIFIVVLAITINTQAQMKVTSNGNVTIGNISNPTSKLQVNGNASFDGWTDIFIDWSGVGVGSGTPTIYPENDGWLQLGKPGKQLGKLYIWSTGCMIYGNTSDERLKENITPLVNPIEKIKLISGYYYNFKREIFPEGLSEDVVARLTKNQIGFLAQEVGKIFPELILPPETEEEFCSMNYDGMIPVLLEAIKEQQTQIENLQFMVSKQATEMILLHEQLTFYQNSHDYSFNKNMSESENSKQNIEGKLFQNTPNPFNTSTTILFEIPENSTSASLIIHDMQGAEIKSYPIINKGIGNIIIQGSELQAGMYMYTLLANSIIVDSKKMILTK